MASTISTTSPLHSEDKPAIRGRKSVSNENRFIAQQFYAHQKIIHYMLIYMLIFSFGVQAVVTQLSHGCKSLWIDCDGNRNDPDDFGATHMALILLKAAGADSFLVGSTYNNEFESNVPEKVTAMQNVYKRATGLGYNPSLWFDASTPSGRKAGTTALKNAIDAATTENKLCIVAAGPYQLIYDAVTQANVSDLSNVIVIGHSSWNMERKSAAPNDKTQIDLVTDFPTIIHDKIKGQNVEFKGDKKFNPDQNEDRDVATNYVGVQRFEYLLNYSTGNAVSNAVNTAYQSIQEMFLYRDGGLGYGDISDVGMTMYLLTGQEIPTLSMLREFIECGISTNGTLASSPNNCIAPLPAGLKAPSKTMEIKTKKPKKTKEVKGKPKATP